MFFPTVNSKEYLLLSHQLDSDEADDGSNKQTVHQRCWVLSTTSVVAIGLIIAVSLLANVYALFTMLQQKAFLDDISRRPDDTSPFAGLSYNTPRRISWNTEYSNSSTSELDELWLNDDPSQHGVIALNESYAAAKGLHEAVPFFWAEETGIYVVSAYHQLHCLQIIYRALKEYRDGVAPALRAVSFDHATHCLDTLRADIKCAADDTPRYLAQTATGSGDGQERMCRDWAQLEAWTEQHDGCFKHIRAGDASIAEIERFKYCSNDSPYLPMIREFFGYADDWQPWPYHDQEEYLLVNGSKGRVADM